MLMKRGSKHRNKGQLLVVSAKLPDLSYEQIFI